MHKLIFTILISPRLLYNSSINDDIFVILISHCIKPTKIMISHQHHHDRGMPECWHYCSPSKSQSDDACLNIIIAATGCWDHNRQCAFSRSLGFYKKPSNFLPLNTHPGVPPAVYLPANDIDISGGI